MSVSSIPLPAEEEQPTELRIIMECATNECIASLRTIAEYAAEYPGADALALVQRIENAATIVARFTTTRHRFLPGRITARVEQSYDDISTEILALVGEVRERDYLSATRTIRKIHNIATQISLLLQV